MKKILCPRCRVINLEGFVTYPNCAGCGALLPGSETPPRTQLWRRRQLGPLVWATLVGAAIVVLVTLAASAIQRPQDDPAQVVVIGQVPHQIRAGDVFVLKLLLESMDGAVERPDQQLRNIRVRIARGAFQRFALLGILPLPDETDEHGSGRYYLYREVDRGTKLQVTLRALRPGWNPISVRVFEGDLTYSDYNTRIKVGPAVRHR